MSDLQTEKMSSIEEIVTRVPLFSGLKERKEALKRLASLMQMRTFASGHTLIREDELGDEFYVLIQGQVSISKKTPDGDTYKVVILKSEIVPAFGEGGLIESEPRSATVTCDISSQCLVLNRSDFENFCDHYPEDAVPILRQISRTLMGRLRQTSRDLMLLHKALMNEIRG